MKKILLLAIAFLGLGTIAQAQDVNVTTSVKKAFETKFAGADDVDWDLDEGNYTAYFIFKDNYTTATFTKAGEWKETTTTLNEDALPKTFTASLGDASYNDITKYETPEKTYFEVEIETDDRMIFYKVGADGKVLSKKEQIF